MPLHLGKIQNQVCFVSKGEDEVGQLGSQSREWVAVLTSASSADSRYSYPCTEAQLMQDRDQM